MPGLVPCGNCAEVLAEPSDTVAEQRIPVRIAARKRRTFELSGTVAVGSDVAVTVSAATARASAPQPTVVIGKLEDAGFDLQWQRLSKDWRVDDLGLRPTAHIHRRLDPGRPAGGVAGGLRAAPTAAKTVRVTE